MSTVSCLVAWPRVVWTIRTSASVVACWTVHLCSFNSWGKHIDESLLIDLVGEDLILPKWAHNVTGELDNWCTSNFGTSCVCCVFCCLARIVAIKHYKSTSIVAENVPCIGASRCPGFTSIPRYRMYQPTAIYHIRHLFWEFRICRWQCFPYVISQCSFICLEHSMLRLKQGQGITAQLVLEHLFELTAVDSSCVKTLK